MGAVPPTSEGLRGYHGLTFQAMDEALGTIITVRAISSVVCKVLCVLILRVRKKGHLCGKGEEGRTHVWPGDKGLRRLGLR